MGGDVCDKETRINFRWSHVLEGVSIIILIALVSTVWEMRDFYHESEALHKNIPDGFFSKERYGVSDAIKDRQFDEAQREVLESRINSLEQNSIAHYREAELWRQTIRDAVTSIHALEKMMWRKSGFESDQ